MAGELSPGAQSLWKLVLPAGVALAEAKGLDTVYASACEMLEARPHFRKYMAFSDSIRLAQPAQQEAMTDKKNTMMRELRERYPNAWSKRFHFHRKLRRRTEEPKTRG